MCAPPPNFAGLRREPLWAQLSNLTIRQRLAHELNERKARIPHILDALLTKAEKGDVPAARELRGWFDQGLGRPEAANLDTGDVDRPYADMTPRNVHACVGVIRRIAEAEALEEGEQAEGLALVATYWPRTTQERLGAGSANRPHALVAGGLRRVLHPGPHPRETMGLLTEPLWVPWVDRPKPALGIYAFHQGADETQPSERCKINVLITTASRAKRPAKHALARQTRYNSHLPGLAARVWPEARTPPTRITRIGEEL